MNALLVWYALVFGCLGVGVYAVTPKTPHRQERSVGLPAWLANTLAYSEPIEGYQDSLFSTDQTQPMEIADGPRAKTTRHH